MIYNFKKTVFIYIIIIIIFIINSVNSNGNNIQEDIINSNSNSNNNSLDNNQTDDGNSSSSNSSSDSSINIKYKNGKTIIGYSFSDDIDGFYKSKTNGIQWALIDVLVLPKSINNLNEIINLAHKNDVKVALMYSYKDVDYIDKETYKKSHDLIINKVIESGADGISLFYKFPVPSNYTLTIKTLNNQLKKLIGKESHFSVSIPFRVGRYDIIEISENCDYVIANAYDLGNSFQNSYPNSPSTPVREELNTRWIQKIKNSNKVILGLPWYGYQFNCSMVYKNKTINLFSEECEKRNKLSNDLLKLSYSSIYKYIVGEGSGYVTSMELWNSYTRTPYINYKPLYSDIQFQIQYDNAKSIYYKIAQTGIGGVAIYRLDSIIGVPHLEIKNMYNSIDRDIFGNKFNTNLKLY